MLSGGVLRQAMQIQAVLNSPVSVPEPPQRLSGNPGAQKRPFSIRFNVQKNIRVFDFSGWNVIATWPGFRSRVFDNNLVIGWQWHHILHRGAECILIIRVGCYRVSITFWTFVQPGN